MGEVAAGNCHDCQVDEALARLVRDSVTREGEAAAGGSQVVETLAAWVRETAKVAVKNSLNDTSIEAQSDDERKAIRGLLVDVQQQVAEVRGLSVPRNEIERRFTSISQAQRAILGHLDCLKAGGEPGLVAVPAASLPNDTDLAEVRSEMIRATEELGAAKKATDALTANLGSFVAGATDSLATSLRLEIDSVREAQSAAKVEVEKTHRSLEERIASLSQSLATSSPKSQLPKGVIQLPNVDQVQTDLKHLRDTMDERFAALDVAVKQFSVQPDCNVIYSSIDAAKHQLSELEARMSTVQGTVDNQERVLQEMYGVLGGIVDDARSTTYEVKQVRENGMELLDIAKGWVYESSAEVGVQLKQAQGETARVVGNIWSAMQNFESHQQEMRRELEDLRMKQIHVEATAYRYECRSSEEVASQGQSLFSRPLSPSSPANGRFAPKNLLSEDQRTTPCPPDDQPSRPGSPARTRQVRKLCSEVRMQRPDTLNDL